MQILMSVQAEDEGSPGETITDQAVENLLPLWIFAAAWMAASVFIVAPMTGILVSVPPVGFCIVYIAAGQPAVALGSVIAPVD